MKIFGWILIVLGVLVGIAILLIAFYLSDYLCSSYQIYCSTSFVSLFWDAFPEEDPFTFFLAMITTPIFMIIGGIVMIRSASESRDDDVPWG